MKDIHCAYADEKDLIPLYLAAKLPESEAEAFERHLFGCEACAVAVREAAEIRAGFGQPVLRTAPATPPVTSRRDVWSLLAAAAAVTAFFFGMRQVTERQELVRDSEVLRSTTSSLSLKTSLGSDDAISFEWSPQPGAHGYRIEIIRTDGVPVMGTETASPRVVLEARDLPPLPAGVSLLARIEALDAVGRTIAESPQQPLPVR